MQTVFFMNAKSRIPTSSKTYKDSATLFSIAGLLFIIVAVVGDQISVLPIGMAFVVISMALWQRSRKPSDNEQKNT